MTPSETLRVSHARKLLCDQHAMLNKAIALRPLNLRTLEQLRSDVRRYQALTDWQLLCDLGWIGENGHGPAIDFECRMAMRQHEGRLVA